MSLLVGCARRCQCYDRRKPLSMIMSFEGPHPRPRPADTPTIPAVEAGRLPEEMELNLRDFLENEMHHYQSKIKDADAKPRSAYPPFPVPDANSEASPDGDEGRAEWHSLMGNYYLRHLDEVQMAQAELESGDHTAVLRYLEEKIAQADSDDERTAEDLRRMRGLELRLYRGLHPEVSSGVPDREQMEAFFRSELAREEQHNRREAESGVGGYWVEGIRDSYLAGELAPALHLVESALGEMSGLTAHYQNSEREGAIADVAEGMAQEVWEAAPDRYAEELRRLWIGLTTELSHTAQ